MTTGSFKLRKPGGEQVGQALKLIFGGRGNTGNPQCSVLLCCAENQAQVTRLPREPFKLEPDPGRRSLELKEEAGAGVASILSRVCSSRTGCSVPCCPPAPE